MLWGSGFSIRTFLTEAVSQSPPFLTEPELGFQPRTCFCWRGRAGGRGGPGTLGNSVSGSSSSWVAEMRAQHWGGPCRDDVRGPQRFSALASTGGRQDMEAQAQLLGLKTVSWTAWGLLADGYFGCPGWGGKEHFLKSDTTVLSLASPDF